jgi:CDP-diacylglycerol--serine O-phosphatidyltransferase
MSDTDAWEGGSRVERPKRKTLAQRLAPALPNGLTLGNALCGFGAIIAVSGWSPEFGWQPIAVASWLILGAWVCDMLDGTVARLVGSTGPFGAALDSLCDVVGFGLAPAFLLGTLARAAGWSPGLAWGAAAFLLACVLVRLARFDTEDAAESGPGGHMYFRGYPSPAVGVLIASFGLTFAQAARDMGMGSWGKPVLTGLNLAVAEALPWVAVIAGALAVTTWRYPDLPKHYVKNRRLLWQPTAVLLVGAFLGIGPALLAFFVLYALIGPMQGRKRRSVKSLNA